MTFSLRAAALCAALVGGTAASSHASLTLNLDFSNFNAGVPNGSLFGGGSPQAVVQAAANYWTTAFASSTKNVSYTIAVNWGPQGGNTLATGGGSLDGGGNLSGNVLTFDNDGTSDFFVDPTPFGTTEYNSFTSSSQNLGGGTINTGRVYSNAPGVAGSNNDMLTTALHEIGHAIGYLQGFNGFNAAVNNNGAGNALTITAPRQLAGSIIPVGGSHIQIDETTMAPGIITGNRKLLSEADILGLAQIQSFNNVNLNPQPVPEPAALGLLGLGATALLRRKRLMA